MKFFKKENTENTGIIEHVKQSFEKVKGEVLHITEWVYFFHQKHQEHDIRLKLLENQLAYMPKTPAEINQIIEQHYSHNYFTSRIKTLNQKVENILDNHRPLIRRLEDVESSLSKVGKTDEPLYHKIKEIHGRIEAIERKAISISNTPKNNLRDKILEKVTKNSKEYVKNIIVSLIEKYGSISGFQLKEIVVDEQGLCSKSSFYRLLGEVERQHPISLIWNGKEKHYALHLSKIV
ncbi:hypothetical protein J4418_03760 [Candidatus Woesearchaeota archaeon]|nr:hypothetical protein [Candidatus Woesearchaeota archaeon]